MKSSIPLFRIAGFNIGINYTWFIIVLLLTWSLAQGYFPQLYPNWPTTAYWIIGGLAAIMLFVSVLVHELAHSIVARSRGMSVSSITLFIFGGVSNLEEEPKQPGTEFVMAIIGPVTSLVLSGIFWGVSRILERGSMVGALFGYLALLNLVLGVFNLLPGFPLDGGRVLRSIVWKSTGNLSKATNIAAFTGQLFGWALITYGFLQLLSGNITGGLWMAFIGWFLNNAADASRKDVSLRERLNAIMVKEVMITKVETIGPDASVEEAVTGILNRKYERAIPVVQNNRLIGIVTMTDIKGLPKEKWTATRVAQIMTSNPLYMVAPEESVDTALSLLASHDVNQVIVGQQNQFLGILRRADIINYLQLRFELGKKG